MNKRTARKLQSKKNEKTELLFMVIGLFGIVCFIYLERKYYVTIIEFRYIPIIYTAAGLIFGTLTYRVKEKITGKAFSQIIHFALTFLTYGSIVCGLFFFLNNNLFTSNNYTVKLQILEKHKAYGRSSPYVVVYTNGIEKDIRFPNIEWNEINDANFVQLTLQDGLFHFPVIKQQQLSIH